MKKPISLVTFLIFINCITLFAQSKEISGRVIGQDDGESIPGVSVKIKGTTIGTVTNFDGTYTLSVPEDAQTIVFSCVGMKSTEVNIDGRFTIDIIMDIDIFGLGDIIITGYTTQTRESLTGSVSTIDKDKIKTSASSNIISHLQGQVSGVTITSDNTPGSENIMVRVRGFDTNSAEPSTSTVKDGSYLRMKNLIIGYSFPQGLINKIKINNLRLYLQLTNLFTLTKYNGLDPAMNSWGHGVDSGRWPTPRQIMLGVNLGL